MTHLSSFAVTVVVGALVGFRFGRVIIGLNVGVVVCVGAAPTATRSRATPRPSTCTTRATCAAALLLEVAAVVRIARVPGASGGAIVPSVRRVRGSTFACWSVAVVGLQISKYRCDEFRRENGSSK